MLTGLLAAGGFLLLADNTHLRTELAGAKEELAEYRRCCVNCTSERDALKARVAELEKKLAERNG